MILGFAVYFGMAYYLINNFIRTVHYFQDKNNSESNDNLLLEDYNLDIEIDNNNVLYKEFLSVVNKNELDRTKKILVCCTGDYQSMALLTIASKFFEKNNIMVFYYNEHYNEHNNTIFDFVQLVCSENDLTFYSTNNNYDNRYKYINELCKNDNISYVFEAHNLINHSNKILADIFNNSKEEVILNNLYKPFIHIDNITLLDFCIFNNIIIDKTFTHLEITRLQDKTIFEDIEVNITNYYPDWRMNMIEHFDNVDFSREINVVKGKYGCYVNIDLMTMSYYSFKKSINKLLNEYNFDDKDDLEEYYYITKLFFISDEYDTKINNFINYLNNINFECLIEELVEKMSNSSFEDLEERNKDELKESNDSPVSNFTSDNEYDESAINECIFENEYIIKVNLTGELPEINIVDKIDNYLEDCLNGIIYANINVYNNTFYIYDSNIECVHNDIKK